MHRSYVCLVFTALWEEEIRVKGKKSREESCNHNVNKGLGKAHESPVSTI